MRCGFLKLKVETPWLGMAPLAGVVPLAAWAEARREARRLLSWLGLGLGAG